MRKPLVINLTGAPGAGKSVGAAIIFAELKKAGINAELVTEFAKDKTWEHNTTALSCQEYIFGKQSYRLARCRDDVDVIVTDSPLLLGLIYNNNPALDYHFTAVVLNVFNTYENINFFINRVKPYNPKGRNQTAEESDQISLRIKDLYKNLTIGYTEINGDNEGYTKAVQEVLNHLEFMKKESVVNL